MWHSWIKHKVFCFTSGHVLDCLVTWGIWVMDKPNTFTSTLWPRTRLCWEARLLGARRIPWCPLSTLGTHPHSSWATGLEIALWWYFWAQGLSCAVFWRKALSGVRQALFSSCELSSPPISPHRSLCRMCFYCTLPLFGSCRVIHFLTVCDQMRGCCRWCKSLDFSWTKNQLVVFDVLC